VFETALRGVREQLLASEGEPPGAEVAGLVPPAERPRVGDVRLHSDAPARDASARLGAEALTVGHDIFLGSDTTPGTPQRHDLLRHELTHVLQGDGRSSLRDRAGLQVAPADGAHERQARVGPDGVTGSPPPDSQQAVVHRQPRGARGREAPERSSYPWKGRVAHTWTAALRSAPEKKESDPHAGTVADLDAGTEVLVVSRKGAWLSVQVAGGQTGYVSQELVDYVSASAFDVGPIVISISLPSIAECFVILKRAETTKKATPSYVPSGDDADQVDLAVALLEKTSKYKVDRSTYQVQFVRTPGKKISVDTIEDFILFVETVELTYPSATPAEVATEVRQIWFSDPNWDLLSSGRGISVGGSEVDIETEPNPVASMFDMKDLAPRTGSKPITTRMGVFGLGHVLAGIDAVLSGFPKSFPGKAGDMDALLKYTKLLTASGGDSRDFTTWAGDLGQAYAEYLVARYVEGRTKASVSTFVADKAAPDALLADIHGYIATKVWATVPVSSSPTGGARTVSNILRDMYLVTKPAGVPLTYREYFELVSGRTGPALNAFVRERTLDFARLWFAKKAVEFRGGWTSQKGWTKTGILDNALDEFDTDHATNESSAAVVDRVGAVVDLFMLMLADKLK